jgi:hypothetical protein
MSQGGGCLRNKSDSSLFFNRAKRQYDGTLIEDEGELNNRRTVEKKK